MTTYRIAGTFVFLATSVLALHSNFPSTASAICQTTVAPAPTLVPTSSVLPTKACFPSVGSIKENFTPEGLEQLWDLVGPVQSPPFTTTRVPQLPVPTPSPPPVLYPSFYAPAPKDILPQYKFPKAFIFGVATAAYQVEGAAKDEGKGPTLWDWGPRYPGSVVDGTDGDISDLQYYLYKEDTARVAALGVNAHSFSISWARIYPFGVAGSPVNQAGLDHYSDLINFSNALGVSPVLTLFHWDTPLSIAAYYGGFTSGRVVDDFVNYAKTVFKAYNGRVKTWYTFNEPRPYCSQIAGYPFNATLADGVDYISAPYVCSYNLLRAHAAAVKAFREMGISGEIAYKNDGEVGQPWRSNSSEDSAAVERNVAFGIGAFSTPVYETGDWPSIMTETLPPSILPRFTEEEKKDIKDSADFFAIDAYTSMYVIAPPSGTESCSKNMSDPAWPVCATVIPYDVNGWAAGVIPDPGTPWLTGTPNTFRYALKQIQERWPTNKIYISEYGFTEPFESQRTELFEITNDVDRTNYFMTYLGEMLLSIHEDKIPIAGAFSWAMVDNAEWASGLSTRFGIQYVNYTTLERTYKRSALSLAEFFAAHL